MAKGKGAGIQAGMSNHTIIYSRGGGRTCDQLLTLAQFVAFAEEFSGEFNIVDVPFWPFGAGFAAFVDNRICSVPAAPQSRRLAITLRVWERLTRTSSGKTAALMNRLRSSAHWRLIRYLEKRAARAEGIGFWVGDTRAEPWEHVPQRRRDFLYLDDPEVLQDLRRHPKTVLCGPKIRCWDLVEKHAQRVRQELRVRADLSAKARAHIEPLRRQYDYLIGILLRQTDYREYAGGRFFFTSEQYARWMREALALFGNRGRVGFLVASDEPQDSAVFGGLPAHYASGFAVGSGHYLENLAELGCCDLVMTTASSFGCWGAFIGDVPILPLVRAGVPLRAEDTLARLWDCTRHPDLKVAIW